MPKIWSATVASHRTAVRDAILDAVEFSVREHGLRSLTMAGLAQRAGIGRATLYKYFPDADAVLLAWHDRAVDRHLQGIVAISEGPGSANERLRGVLEQVAVNAHADRGRHDAELVGSLHGDERIATVRHHLNELVIKLLQEAAAAGAVRRDLPPHELAAYCVAALSAAAHASSRAAIQRLVDVTLAGLRPSPQAVLRQDEL